MTGKKRMRHNSCDANYNGDILFIIQWYKNLNLMNGLTLKVVYSDAAKPEYVVLQWYLEGRQPRIVTRSSEWKSGLDMKHKYANHVYVNIVFVLQSVWPLREMTHNLKWEIMVKN